MKSGLASRLLALADCGVGGTEPSKLDVRPAASPGAGTLATAFKVTWAARNATPGLVYDVREKPPGATSFMRWQAGVSVPSSRFTPTPPGSYAFDARLRGTADGVATG